MRDVDASCLKHRVGVSNRAVQALPLHFGVGEGPGTWNIMEVGGEVLAACLADRRVKLQKFIRRTFNNGVTNTRRRHSAYKVGGRRHTV